MSEPMNLLVNFLRDCLETRSNPSFWTAFSKNSILFLLKIIFFMFSDHFDVLISKIIFLKKKSFWCISKWKTLWTATTTTIPNKLACSLSYFFLLSLETNLSLLFLLVIIIIIIIIKEQYFEKEYESRVGQV